MGWFHPSEVGEKLMLMATGISPAVYAASEAGRNILKDPDVISAFNYAYGLELELRGPDGKKSTPSTSISATLNFWRRSPIPRTTSITTSNSIASRRYRTRLKPKMKLIGYRTTRQKRQGASPRSFRAIKS
jgi:hypothetical protein